MQTRSFVYATLFHAVVLVGVGVGIHAFATPERPSPRVTLQPFVPEQQLPTEPAIEEPVLPEPELEDAEFVEPEFAPAPVPAPDPEARDKPVEDREPIDSIVSSPSTPRSSPELLVRIKPRPKPTPPVEVAQPEPPANASTDAVALEEKNVAPEYPEKAARRKIEGTVILLVDVDARGEVTRVELLESAGLTRFHRMLDKAAIMAIGQWRYQPATENGKPIATTIRQPVVFQYRRK